MSGWYVCTTTSVQWAVLTNAYDKTYDPFHVIPTPPTIPIVHCHIEVSMYSTDVQIIVCIDILWMCNDSRRRMCHYTVCLSGKQSIRSRNYPDRPTHTSILHSVIRI